MTSLPDSNEDSSMKTLANKNNLNLSELKQTDIKEKHTAVDYLVAERETLEQEKGGKKERREKDGEKMDNWTCAEKHVKHTSQRSAATEWLLDLTLKWCKARKNTWKESRINKIHIMQTERQKKDICNFWGEI